MAKSGKVLSHYWSFKITSMSYQLLSHVITNGDYLSLMMKCVHGHFPSQPIIHHHYSSRVIINGHSQSSPILSDKSWPQSIISGHDWSLVTGLKSSTFSLICPEYTFIECGDFIGTDVSCHGCSTHGHHEHSSRDIGRRSVGRCRLGSNLKFSARVLRYLK